MEQLSSLVFEIPTHSCHTVDTAVTAFSDTVAFCSFSFRVLLGVLCRFGEPRVLFVPNVALCQGKQLKHLHKTMRLLWLSIPSCCIPSSRSAFPFFRVCLSVWGWRLLGLTLSHSSNLQRRMPDARRRREFYFIFFFFYLGEQLLLKVWGNSCQPVCLRMNSFCCHTTAAHMHLREWRCSIEAFQIFFNTFTARVPGWWNGCRLHQ